jgi:hypothetical protein
MRRDLGGDSPQGESSLETGGGKKKVRMSDLDHVTDRTLASFILRNPVNAWTGEGRQRKTPVFFRYESLTRLLIYTGKGAERERFREAVEERVEYRIREYFLGKTNS